MKFQKYVLSGQFHYTANNIRDVLQHLHPGGFTFGQSSQQWRYIPTSPQFFQHKGLKLLFTHDSSLGVMYRNMIILNPWILVEVTGDANSPFFHIRLHSSSIIGFWQNFSLQYILKLQRCSINVRNFPYNNSYYFRNSMSKKIQLNRIIHKYLPCLKNSAAESFQRQCIHFISKIKIFHFSPSASCFTDFYVIRLV